MVGGRLVRRRVDRPSESHGDDAGTNETPSLAEQLEGVVNADRDDGDALFDGEDGDADLKRLPFAVE